MPVTDFGKLIAGRYRLIDRIAVGGMGVVWEGQDELLGRRVAVKQVLIQPGLSEAEALLARHRVIREARITARLHHPHAVTIYDVVDDGDYPCLIMQFVPSSSLTGLLRERGTIPPAQVSRIGADLAGALQAAHEVGIVHRDVKPGNVLITDDGSAKLTDFGISHAAGDVTLTSTGMVSGTPAYLAPEVARGGTSDFAADVFSLGATMYAALEGTPPFVSNPTRWRSCTASRPVRSSRRSVQVR
jgi:serine/threonine protein kinase